MKPYIKITFAFMFTVLFVACSKDLLNEEAPSVLTADNLYKNKAGFDAGINGLYSEARRARGGAPTATSYSGPNQLMTEPAFIGVDNAYGNWRDALEDVFNYWGAANNASVPLYSDIWAWLYETINAANTVINRANNTTVLSDDEKNQVLAEARFMRAWCYRHLTYLWGDVPLTLDESSGSAIKTDWDRTPVADVRKAMEADWLFAEQYLQVTPAMQGKVTKGAAQHYLAELYLAENNPGKARDYALKVTTNASYKLVTVRYGVNLAKPGTAFTDMFLDGNSNRGQGNTEALWVMQNEIGVIGGEGFNIMRRYWVNRYYSLAVKGIDGKSTNPILVDAENGGRAIGRLGPTKWALGIYEKADDRGSNLAWRFAYRINNPTGVPAGYKLGDSIILDRTSNEKITNANWPNTRKWDYFNPLEVNQQYNDQVYIRSAETYLLLAEAYLKLDDAPDAAIAINAVRTRSHASPITGAVVTLDFILDERSRELFSEEERRYTLLRTGKWMERTMLYNKVVATDPKSARLTERDKLLPIPQKVIDANITKKMVQNPNY
jgi:hypothetical protein